MTQSKNGLIPMTNGHFENLVKQTPQIKDWLTRFHVVLHFNEYSPLLDSSQMVPNDWWSIFTDIEANYDYYDGFIVVHGTDTLAYTSSMLSFLIQHTGKPIVLTGAQRPIEEPDSDGIQNMLDSIIVASCRYTTIAKVCVVFNRQVIRGCRVTKISAVQDDAFSSPRKEPLAQVMDYGIKVHWKVRGKLGNNGNLNLESLESHLANEVKIMTIKIFPGFDGTLLDILTAPISSDTMHLKDIQNQVTSLKKMCLRKGTDFERIKQGLEVIGNELDVIAVAEKKKQPLLKGLVIEAYGMGTGPNNQKLKNVLIKLRKAKIPVIVVCQPIHGSADLQRYQVSGIFNSHGAIGGYDITTEAALTKLHYLIGRGLRYSDIKREFAKNLRGEISKTLSLPRIRLTYK